MEPRSIWISGGDYNAILKPIDVEGGTGFDRKKCAALADLIKSANLVDIFRTKFPTAQEFNFHRTNCASSRLDKFYIARNLVNAVQNVAHVASLSDHFAVKMRINLNLGNAQYLSHQRHTYWKLNTSILDDESLMPSFKLLWEDICTRENEYVDVAD